MKGSFKPLLKRIKMCDAREGMLFMHPDCGMCRIIHDDDINEWLSKIPHPGAAYTTVKNARRGTYFAEHIWIAIGWTNGCIVHRSDERVMSKDIDSKTELASMIRRCSQYKENTSKGVLW